MSDEINPFSRDSHPSNQSSQQQYENAQRQSPPRQKSLGLILALVLGFFAASLVCCGSLAFLGYRAGSGLISQPVNAAIAYVSADEEIANKIGTPIESTSAIGIQNYQNDNGNGGAKVGFNAKGPDGTARVDGSLTLTEGTWNIDTLTVKFSDGSSVTLPRETTPPQEDPKNTEHLPMDPTE